MDGSLEPLTRLMSAARSGRSPVSFGRKRTYRWEEFQGHVAGLCGRLANQPRGRWRISTPSSYAFAVGLLALWQTDRVAVLPPNQQPDSLSDVSGAIDGVLSDASAPPNSGPWLAPLSATAPPRIWKDLNPSRRCLELFTSGSTGARKPVTKLPVQLESEIAVLEETFGRRLGRCQVHASVTHQHIYGLLFRLLWPLCAGRPFADETCLLWEDLGPRLRRSSAVCLVSSPAHLERISPAGKKALQAARPQVIFSSGGPLHESAVKLLREKTGRAPLEVFGSTETGGVGWRQRSGRSAAGAWTPLRGATVSHATSNRSGRLSVRSPFVSSATGVFLMGDRGAVFKDGTFRLDGRVDRVIKIAEKRLSLEDMERRLARHPWVAENQIVVLDRPSPTSRVELGAVVVLHTKGQKRLDRAGRPALTAALRNHLQKSFEASTLPRAFRFIESLPRDTQGKQSRAALLKFFRFNPAVLTPERLNETKGKSSLRLRFRVPPDLAYLEGHFPDHPIVPGIVQLRWVVDAAARWLNRGVTVRRMEAVKFKNILMPGQTFWMTMERGAPEGEETLRFTLADKETLYSSGRLVLA